MRLKDEFCNAENYTKICLLKKVEKEWKFFDCDNNELKLPSPYKYKFSSAMNIRYRKKRKIGDGFSSCVWILIGSDECNTKKLLQVGRTKTLKNMLSTDIKEDIKNFFYKNGKYGVLNTNEKFKELIFYEIDVKNYIKKDEEAEEILGVEPENEFLKQAYWIICASYIEGKISALHNAELYCPSTLDGCYHEYYKEKKEEN